MFEVIGFVLAFALGAYFTVAGVLGAIAGYGFTGQMKNAIPGIVFAGLGLTILALCVIYSPFTVSVAAA